MYYIVSHDRMSGVGTDDSLYGNGQSDYLELGWELAASRIYFNFLFESGSFNNEKDWLVAATDRIFLYSKYVKNIIPYSVFHRNYVQNPFLFYGKIRDLTANGLHEAMTNIIPDSYHYTDIVKNLNIHTQINLLNEENIVRNKNKFICIAVRRRGHEPGRSMPDVLVNKIIKTSIKNNIDVYVFGKGCEDYDNGKNIHHVSYQECATLLNSDNCILFVSSLSGGGMIRFFTGKCKHIVLDCLNEYDVNNPFNYGNDIDFSSVIKNGLLDMNNNADEFFNKIESEIRSRL